MAAMAAMAAVLFLLLAGAIRVSKGASFTFENNCEQTIWPGLLSGAGSPPLPTTGFALAQGESRSVPAPAGWSGRFWARTGCAGDPAAGAFACATADCGRGTVACGGAGAAPPATLAEFTLSAAAGGSDFFDVSLVDGFNLPVLVSPSGGKTCSATGCVADVNGACPRELAVVAGGETVACRSACGAFGKPEFCCSGAFANPNTCRPSSFSQVFKNACPRAYSYAYDDRTSTFTCPAGSSYRIVFCPSTSSQKSAGTNPTAVPAAGGGGDGGGGDVIIYQGFPYSGAAAAAATAALVAWSFLLVLLV
ncbi:thaumatin-like protein 1b [Wolffia australiana]